MSAARWGLCIALGNFLVKYFLFGLALSPLGQIRRLGSETIQKPLGKAAEKAIDILNVPFGFILPKTSVDLFMSIILWGLSTYIVLRLIESKRKTLPAPSPPKNPPPLADPSDK